MNLRTMARSPVDWGGNIVAFALTIAANVMANAVPLGGQTMGEVSAKYPSLFTPAGYTFSIWGVIYAALAAFVVYQALPAQRANGTLAGIGLLFKLNCVANALWIFAWHYHLLLLSLVLMGVILLSLLLMYRKLGIVDSSARPGERWLVQAPISLYTAWIAVAAIANASAVQTGFGMDNLGLSAATWTQAKLALAGSIAALVVARRGDVLFALVIAWAAAGIAAGQAATPAVAGAAAMLAMLALLLALAELPRRYLGSE